MKKPFKIKDPGSAVIHFIGMLMAMFAAVPLLIKAAREPDRIHLIALAIFHCQHDSPVCGQHYLSYAGSVRADE